MSEEDDAARLRRWLDAPEEDRGAGAPEADVVGLFRQVTERPTPDVWAAIVEGQGAHDGTPSGDQGDRRPMRASRTRRFAVLGAVAALLLVVGLVVSSRGGRTNTGTPGPSAAQAEAALAALVPRGDPRARLAALNDVAHAARRRLLEEHRR
ncbi:MAG: hypothetical protein ACI9OJ_000446 [Myxococcota bacterium]|jgi:hypothetical protein